MILLWILLILFFGGFLLGFPNGLTLVFRDGLPFSLSRLPSFH